MHTNRRRILQGGIASAVGLFFANKLQPASAGEPTGKAKSLIVLWMNGGPSHIDTFDPKKGKDGGPFKAIDTNVSGIQICEHLPQVAEQADKLAIIRSMTSKEGNHDRARFFAHTGYVPNPTVAYPSLGSWISKEKGGKGTLPSFISVGGPSHGGGFLGIQHAPFAMRRPGGLPENVAYGFGVDRTRFNRRIDGLDFLEKQFAATTHDASIEARSAVYERAYKMMQGKDVRAFDLSAEPTALRNAYGDTNFGRGCLLARRLIESGVSVVEVTQGGWDTHDNGFDRSENLMGELDPAMATLLKDLADRNLLDSTLVLWMGEFGRTPRVNQRDGRGHHPRAWSAVLGGGGIRGGIAYGATDARGEKVVDKPMSVPNLFATIAAQLGINPAKRATTPGGRPITMTDMGAPILDLIA